MSCNVQNEGIIQAPSFKCKTRQDKNCISSSELQLWKERCHAMENILCYGEIFPMPNIIKEYRNMSDFYLQQLAKEIEIYRFNTEERNNLLDFLNYLRSITDEIEDMLFVEH